MSCNAKEIGDVVRIINRDLSGAIVRQVMTPSLPDRIVIELWADRKNHYLQFVLSASTSRICRIPSKPKRSESPHPFVMLLRRELKGMMIQEISQINDDRVVRIDASNENKNGTLVVELTSRHGNMFWLDGENSIGGSFSVNRSHKRQLVPGRPYVPPLPHSSRDNDESPRFETGSNLEQEIETHYRKLEAAQRNERQRDHLRRVVKTGAKRLNRLLKNLEGDKERADQGERLANFGHLLKANLHLLKKGQRELDTFDFEGNETTIPLDPRLGPVANMERLFSKSKRLIRAVSKIEKRRAETHSLSKLVIDLGSEIDKADKDRLTHIEKELQKHFPGLVKQRSSKRREKQERTPYKEFSIAAGRTARVGRSARDNDALTLRHAKPDDLWLHVRGRAGSHVVVAMGRGEDPSEAILVDAAHLAAHFSDARGDSDVEVVYTRRRYVQKPKGAAVGSVRLLREKTINLRIEPDRLEQLLTSK